MDTPGYDPPCTTGLVAGGANVLVFTTGRGQRARACKPTPCIKVATNTPMYERMIDDMDLDAGPILDGTATVTSVGGLFELILEVAAGRQTVSEELDLGADEFVPWQLARSPDPRRRVAGSRGLLGQGAAGRDPAEVAHCGVCPPPSHE